MEELQFPYIFTALFFFFSQEISPLLAKKEIRTMHATLN